MTTAGNIIYSNRMNELQTYTLYAILHELNGREFRKKLDRYHQDQHFMVMLANSIIGSENARRIEETPRNVVQDSEAFVEKLVQITDHEKEDLFRQILQTHLIETVKDELSFSCPNCRNFLTCANIVNLNIGELFKQRVEGDETNELKKEIKSRVDIALENTPYLDSEEAHMKCNDFTHQYGLSGLGEVFRRYLDIAADLQKRFGIDYKSIQLRIIEINMDFERKVNETKGSAGQ